MISCPPIFNLRGYEKRDFEHLFALDRLCFEPGIAYSRAELSSFIQQRRATTIVAEWNVAGQDAGQNSGESAGEGSGATAAAAVPAAAVSTEAAPSAPAIAGFVTFHLQRQGYGHIITIDVHPDARRHGLGTLLLEAVFARLRKVTAFMVVLEVAVNNHAALAFYEKLGFVRVRVLEHYYSRDVDAILMTRRL